VAEVRLSDDTDDTALSLQADEAFDVWTTAAYSWQDFGANATGGNVYLPVILKELN
jgi:hypothetical protein